MSIERKQFLVWLMIMVVFGGDVPRRMTARDVRAHFAARSPPGDWKPCDVCEGSGRADDARCETCRGDGWIYVRRD